MYGNVQDQLDVMEKEEKENAKNKVGWSSGTAAMILSFRCSNARHLTPSSLTYCVRHAVTRITHVLISHPILISVVSCHVVFSLSRWQVANLQNRLVHCTPLSAACPSLEARLVACLQGGGGGDPLACKEHVDALVACTTEGVVVSE